MTGVVGLALLSIERYSLVNKPIIISGEGKVIQPETLLIQIHLNSQVECDDFNQGGYYAAYVLEPLLVLELEVGHALQLLKDLVLEELSVASYLDDFAVVTRKQVLDVVRHLSHLFAAL